MRTTYFKNIKKQAGITILEVVISISLIGIIYGFTATELDNSSKRLRDQNAAQYQQAVVKAANAYIKDNFATLASTATATQAVATNIATLKAGNYLPAGFNDRNSYNQTPCILTLEPTANKLESFVVTEGGQAISAGRIPALANMVGSSGGYVLADNVTAQGSFGSFSRNITNFRTANCSGTATNANHLASALFMDGNELVNDYLYRSSVPGRPEANTMTTPLVMNAVMTSGASCTQTGAIARDSAGNVLSCQGGAYQQQGSAYWKDPVALYSNLPICNASNQWQTRLVQTPTLGTGPRAFSCNGTAWVALGVDDNGDLVVPRNANVTGNLNVAGNVTLGDAATDTVTVAGTANINRLGGNLEVTSVATENTACSPNGRIARDSNGLILSCQGGVWLKASKTASISCSTGQAIISITPQGNGVCGNPSAPVTPAPILVTCQVFIGFNQCMCTDGQIRACGTAFYQ